MKYTEIRTLAIGLVLGISAIFAIGCGGQPRQNTTPDANTGTRKPEAVAPSQASFIAVGDIMLSRGVARMIDRERSSLAPFSGVADLLNSTDFNFANLESPISGNDTRVGKGLVFNTRRKDAEGLVKYKFKIVQLANNHALDQLADGLRNTRSYLTQLGIEYAGVGEDKNGAWQGKVITANGIKIGFIAASYASINDNGTTYNQWVARIEEKDMLRESIRKLKAECDIVIVGMHAGVEYTRRPHGPQVDFARAAIDGGADMVIGQHPHWIQTHEKYQGKYIFYSLGNFIFDQRKPDTVEGLMLRINVKRGSDAGEMKTKVDRVELIPVIIEKFGIPRPANKVESAAILKKIDITDPILVP